MKQICKLCKELKDEEDYYKTSNNRLDQVCKACRKSKRRTNYRKKIAEDTVEVSPMTDEVDLQRRPEQQSDSQIYKEYKYPDGRILRLTKDEFEVVCEAFRMLLNSERKREGKPLLMG